MPRWRRTIFCAGILTLAISAASGCQSLRPSNERAWEPSQSVVARAIVDGSRVTVKNVRNCRWLSPDDYVLDWYDATYDLDRLVGVDFVVVPFKDAPSLAHTMLSFAFDDGRQLAVSVEIRREVGEEYSPVKGLARQYELMYVVGDERDLIQLRTNHRRDDVYLYRTVARPEKVRSLFLDVMGRVNRLADQPEFYNTLANNCTSNIVAHINRISPGRVPLDPRLWLPGRTDELAYELGLLRRDVPFEQLRTASLISDQARRADGSADFSQAIRR